MEDLDSESGEIRPKFLFYKAKMASQVFPEIWEMQIANICIRYGLRRSPLEKQNGENKVKSYPSRVLHGCFEVVFQPCWVYLHQQGDACWEDHPQKDLGDTVLVASTIPDSGGGD